MNIGILYKVLKPYSFVIMTNEEVKNIQKTVKDIMALKRPGFKSLKLNDWFIPLSFNLSPFEKNTTLACLLTSIGIVYTIEAVETLKRQKCFIEVH